MNVTSREADKAAGNDANPRARHTAAFHYAKKSGKLKPETIEMFEKLKGAGSGAKKAHASDESSGGRKCVEGRAVVGNGGECFGGASILL